MAPDDMPWDMDWENPTPASTDDEEDDEDQDGSVDLTSLSPETLAQLMKESGGRSDAVSPKGARGLMQIMPDTGKDPGYGVAPLANGSDKENVRLGEDYREALVDHYGDRTLGLMAYNWGPGNVDRWLENGGNPADVPAETVDYVNSLWDAGSAPARARNTGTGKPWEMDWSEENSGEEPWKMSWDKPKKVGIGEAALHGIEDALRGLGAIKDVALKEEPGYEAPVRPEAEAPRLKDVLSGEVWPKMAYGVSRTAPSMATAIAGGAAAGAATGGNPIAGAVGAGLGGAAGTMLQEIGPIYAQEYARVKNVDKALDAAMNKAATEGGISGAMFGAFGIAPFKGILKNLILQTAAVQPAVGAGGQAVRNVQEGHPLEERTGEAAEAAALMTAIPGLAHAGIKMLGPKRAAEPPPVDDVNVADPKMIEAPRMVVTPEGRAVTETEAFNMGINPETMRAAREAQARAPVPEEPPAPPEGLKALPAPEARQALPPPQMSGIFVQGRKGMVQLTESQADVMRRNIARYQEMGLTPDVLASQRKQTIPVGPRRPVREGEFSQVEDTPALPAPIAVPDVFVADPKGQLRQATTADIIPMPDSGQITPKTYRFQPPATPVESTPVEGQSYRVTLPDGTQTQAMVTKVNKNRATISTEDGRKLSPLIARTKFMKMPEEAQQTRAEFKPSNAPQVKVEEPVRQEKPVKDNFLRIDNPGGEWLKGQQERSAEMYKRKPTSGAVTATTREPIVYLPVEFLSKIPGEMKEKRAAGDYQYDNLLKKIKEEGYNPDYENTILVGVNYLGEPHIIEGNTRVVVARELGVKQIPAEVRYFAGGEQKTRGTLSPQILKKLVDETPQKIEKNEVTPEKAAPKEQTVFKTIKPRKYSPPTYKDILQFIGHEGGISPDDALIGDVRAMDLHRRLIPGSGPLVRKGGKPLDMLREAAVEAGYLRDQKNDFTPTTSRIQDLLEIMDRTSRGDRVFSEFDVDAVLAKAEKKKGENLPDDAEERAAYAEEQRKFEEEDQYAAQREQAVMQRAEELGIEAEPGTSVDDIADMIAEREGMMQYQREPKSEKTKLGDQFVMPGAEQSARQAAQSREDAGRGKIVPKKEQKPADEGLFAEKTAKEPTLFNSKRKSKDLGEVTPAEKTTENEAYAKELQDFVNKVMGDKGVKVNLVKALRDQDGGSVTGAFSPQHKLMYVALHGEKGMREMRELFNTTRHETIHAIKNSGLLATEEWKALSRAAEDRWIKKYKIDENYSHLDKEARIEEAVAEAYAARGTMKEGPFIKRVFDKIAQFFGAVKDFVSGKSKMVKAAEDVFAKVDDGKLAEMIGERVKAPETPELKFQKERFDDSIKTFGKELKDAAQHIGKSRIPGSSFLTSLLFAHDSEMRSIADKIADPKGRDVMKDILDQWSAKAGEARGVKETYEEGVQSRTNSMINKLAKILGEHDEDLPMLNKAVELMQNPDRIDPNTVQGKMARDLTRMLNDQTRYMREAGVTLNTQKGYFPRIYDPEKVLRNGASEQRFLRDAEKAYQLDPSIGPAKAKELAQAWLENIKFGDGDSLFKVGGSSAIPNFLKERVLGKEADNVMREWLEQDPRVVLTNYLTRSTKRAEMVRRLGEDMSGWDKMQKDLRDTGADYTVPFLRDYIANLVGIRPRGVDYGTNSILSWVRTWGTIGLLERATLTSLPEFITPVIRSGNLLDLGRSLSTTIKALMGKAKGDQELAEDLGLIVASINPTIQASRWGGGDPLSKLQQKVLSKYFQRTGLEQWTNATRVAATNLAQTFVRRLANNIRVGKEAKLNETLLSELGIDPKMAKDFSRWVLSMNDGMPQLSDLGLTGHNQDFVKAYRTALTRFVEQSILVPKASMKPKWATTPLGSVLFQLQAYNWAFQKQVINRIGNLAGNRNLSTLERARLVLPTVALLPLLTAAAYAVGEAREAIFTDPRKKKTDEEKMWLALDRSLTGAMSPLINLGTGIRYNRDIATTLAGPALGNVLGATEAGLKAAFDNSDKTNTAERRLATAFYDVGVEPTVNFLLTGTPVGLASAAATQVVGAPKLREGFVTAIAGPGDERPFRTKLYERLGTAMQKMKSDPGKSSSDKYKEVLEDIKEFNKTAQKPITGLQIKQALTRRMKDAAKK